jgi:glycosyltransferase involved in cell wall biosynthesis
MVSIITATYNSDPYILETYQSIRNQSHHLWEWLVTDDCSNDSTREILTKIRETDHRVKMFKTTENSGAAVARNISLANASGEFIAFIDSDDLWEIDKLDLQLTFMSSHVDFSFTPYRVFFEKIDRDVGVVDHNEIQSVDYYDMLQKAATLGCSTVILRASAFSMIEMPLLRTGQDYALWLKLLKIVPAAHKLNTPLTRYRIRKNSISRNKFKKAMRQWQIYRQLESLPLSHSMYCFLIYAFRAVFRR